MSRPLVITGHRGAMAVEPENTLRSFQRAARDGADWIELDLHASSDGALMVIHDPTLDRTTDGSGRIGECTRTELHGLDAGLGEPVPTFADVLAVTALAIQVEVKDARVVPPLVTMLRDRPALRERLVLSSFASEILNELRLQVPDYDLGLITRDGQVRHLDQVVGLGARYWYPGKKQLSRAAVTAANDRGVRVVTWLVDTVDDLQRALDCGVAGVSSNDPGRIVDLLSA